MSKAALVLSGGGGKGAFQAAAEKYAREEKGYEWSVISGVSIGAFNGAMLAMRRYHRMEQLWNTVGRDDIMTGRKNWLGYLRLLWATSIYDHEPLRRMVEREVDVGRMSIPLLIGAVSLQTGEYVTLCPTKVHSFHDALMASMSVPIFFPPERVEPFGSMVDGGVRSLAPLGEVLAYQPDEVMVINTGPWRIDRRDDAARNSLSIAGRTLEIMMNEIILNDVRSLFRINRLVAQAERAGCALKNENGRPYRHYDCTVIQPDEPLGETLDFSRETLDRNWELGWQAAKKTLG